jgi:hypothetical protein
MRIEDSLEETLTVAACRVCDRSEHLTEQEDHYWCAWCGGPAEITLRAVRVITKATADRHTVDGMLVDPENAPLQPLRITTGWRVQYNNALYEVDATPNTVQWWWIFKSDMLVLVHDQRGRLLDVCWTPEMDWEEGRYRLNLYEGTDFRGRVLRSYEGRDRQVLVAEIETILRSVTQGQL